MTLTANTTPTGGLKDAADRLLKAAMDYHAAYRKAGLAGAVVWIKDTDGRMVILTRGEYGATLMRNIDTLYGEADEPLMEFDPPAAGVALPARPEPKECICTSMQQPHWGCPMHSAGVRVLDGQTK